MRLRFPASDGSRRPAPIAPLLMLAALAVQFAPVLAGRVYRFEDIAGYFEPLWTAAARAMRQGRWPIWDGGAWSGQPLVGDPQAGIFYPLNWLWLAMPVLRAYAASVALHAAIAALGMYALARARGRTTGAAAAAGIALGIGGFVVLQVRHVMFVQATAWVPWVAFCAWRWLERRSAGALAGTALSTGMLLLTGGVSMIYFGAWFLAALLLPRALSPSPGHRRGPAAAALCIAATLGLALAAPSLLPAAAHGAISPRALGTDYPFAASIAWGGLHYLPSLFLPNLLGQEVRGTYVGGGTQWEIAGYYAGLLTFGFAIYALAAGPRVRRAERIAFGAIFLLAVLLAPGAHSPVHRLAYRLLPLYGSMRCPPRALYVFTLAVPLLAADGIDLLRARLLGPWPRIAAIMAIALPALIAIDLLVTHRAENPTITLAEARAQAFPDEVLTFLRRQPGGRYVNDVHLPHALHNSGLLWGLENASGYSSLPIWRYLHLLWIANHGRVYPHPKLHDDLAAQGIWRFGSPVVDLLGIRWVLAPAGWDPGAPGYVKRLGAGSPNGRNGTRPIEVWENTEAMPRAFLVERVLEVRSPAEAAAVVAASQQAATPVSAPPALGTQVTPRAIDLRREAVLESAPGAAPTVALVPLGAAPDATAVHAPAVVRVRRPGPAHSPDASGPADSVDPAADAPRFTDAMAREADVETPSPRLLVFSEPAHPGWRATVDDAPVPVEAADYALVGVRVPAGRHAVRLFMTARPLRVGAALSALAALGIAAIALGGLRRPVRRAG